MAVLWQRTPAASVVRDTSRRQGFMGTQPNRPQQPALGERIKFAGERMTRTALSFAGFLIFLGAVAAIYVWL